MTSASGPGPRVVAIGGGYGLSTTLRAVRSYAGDIAAVVSVADDGGSSGRLRRAFGMPAPGDLRRCLVALAEDGSPWAEAFEHRFTASELEGHPLGNIILAGLTESTGDFARAIEMALRLLGGVGRVIPATAEPVVLKATFSNLGQGNTPGGPVQGTVEGEEQVGNTVGVTSISVVPAEPVVPAAAIEAIDDADQIVIGPGSLYTSVLAVLTVPAVREALAGSPAQRVYVANLGEQHPETTGYDVTAHVEALRAHGVEPDVVLADPATLPIGRLATSSSGPRLVTRPLTSARSAAHPLHDPERLGRALAELVFAD